MYCIYRIRNKINGNTYIGQHKYKDASNMMGRYKGSGILLHKAYKKYGEENFETEILYSRILNKDTANTLEIFAIEKYKPEYNIAKGGTGGDLGAEVRKLQKAAALRKYQRLRDAGIRIESYAKGHYSMESHWNSYIYYYCNSWDGYKYCYDLGRRQYKANDKKKALAWYNKNKSWTITGKLEDAWNEWTRRYMNGLYGYYRNYDRGIKHNKVNNTSYENAKKHHAYENMK